MVRHLFTLIWNKKKQNALLIIEMFVSFLVLFAVFTMLVHFYRNYRKPMGMQYENVWAISYQNPVSTENNDSLVQIYEAVKRSLLSLPDVKSASFTSGNSPFSQSTIQTSTAYNDNEITRVNLHDVEDSFAGVLGMTVSEGRWFNETDNVSKNRPVVINRTLKEALFGNGNAIGQLLGKAYDASKHKVVGVVEDAKFKGDYTQPGYAMFTRIDTGSFRWLGKMLVSIDANAGAAAEEKVYKTLANAMTNAHIEIEHLTNQRRSTNYFALVPMIVLSIICTFLIVNVALGLFGVLWYNINKRRGEIGLRRAVGASARSISLQLVSESLVLATLALLIGSFFAVQLPLLNVFDLHAGVYLTALALAVAFIFLLVLICSLYPGKQAAAIYPATALHEE